MIAQTFLATLAVLASVQVAQAAALEPRSNLTASANGWHFPDPRAWSDNSDSKAPCGGMPLGLRENFPISGGELSILNYKDGEDVQFRFSTKENPTSNNDFVEMLPTVDDFYRGHYCLTAPDFATLGVSVGDHVTFQLRYVAGTDDATLYQCADVTIVDSASFVLPHGSYCINGHRSVESVDTESYGDSFGLSAGAKGGIGAGVAVAGLLLIGLAYFLYSRKQKKTAARNADNDAATIAESDSHMQETKV